MIPPWPSLFRCLRVVVSVSFVAAAASATLTAPVLRLDSVEAEATMDGGWVRVTGTFPYAAAVAQDYGLQLFIRQADPGERFVCYSTQHGVLVGQHESVLKGITAKELEKLGDHTEPSPTGRFLQITPNSIEVLLPPDFPGGAAEAQLYVVYRGTPLFSNPIAFQIEAVEEAPE